MLKVALATFEFCHSHVFSSHLVMCFFWFCLTPTVSSQSLNIFFIRFLERFTESSSPCHHQPGCENPYQFQQSVRESIALNHLSVAHMHSSPCQKMTSTVFSWVRLMLVVLVLLSDVLGVEVFLLAPTASGDGAGPRFCEPLPTLPRFTAAWPEKTSNFLKSKFLTPFFCLVDPQLKHSEVMVESGGNFEDYIIFLSCYNTCHVFGPLNHGHNWKGWERSGGKAWLSVIIKPKRLDFDDTINLSILIVNLTDVKLQEKVMTYSSWSNVRHNE